MSTLRSTIDARAEEKSKFNKQGVGKKEDFQRDGGEEEKN